MDLGATLCTRSRPHCEECPLQADCAAYSTGGQTHYPGKKPKKTLPVKQTRLLMIRDPHGAMLLEKRPARGIWGGLWCFPEAADLEPEKSCIDHTGMAVSQLEAWPVFRHTFSHYHLDIEPWLAEIPASPGKVMDADRQLWYNVRQPPQIGLAAPVVGLLAQLARPGQAKE
jgi:A/G-specific adenine glycosylase